MPDQISLFEGDGSVPKRRRRPPAWPAPGSALEQRYERYRVLAASLPRPSNWHPGVSSTAYARYVVDIEGRMERATFLWRALGAGPVLPPILDSLIVDSLVIPPLDSVLIPDSLRDTVPDTLPDTVPIRT
jgi:hypothetical protein